MRGLCRLLITRAYSFFFLAKYTVTFPYSADLCFIYCLYSFFFSCSLSLLFTGGSAGWDGFVFSWLLHSACHSFTWQRFPPILRYSFIPSRFFYKFYFISLVCVCWSRFARISCRRTCRLPEFGFTKIKVNRKKCRRKTGKRAEQIINDCGTVL